jgi:SAM-dependent methyltransferase
MADADPEVSFAAVYDVVHESAPDFLRAQLAFLQDRLGPRRALLDAGCGTGRHLLALSRAGYTVTGLDASRAMLALARAKLAGQSLPAHLVRGLLQSLPFSPGSFDGALCLESPLAYLFSEEELARALAGLRRVLRPGGLLLIDVFDYPGTFGKGGTRPQKTHFDAPWGRLEVTETHRHRAGTGAWVMTQTFAARRADEVERFSVEHRLRVRSANDYAAALERAGFIIRELLPAYPGSPSELRSEARMIFLASG